MQILVLILAPIGDTIFTTPALKALRDSYPEANIEVLVNNNNQGVLAGNTNIDRLIVIDNKTGLLAKILSLQNKGYDFAIGLSHFGSYLLPLIKADRKAGFKARLLGWSYDYQVPDNRNIHAVNYCHKVVETAGVITGDDSELELAVREKHRQYIRKIMKARGINLRSQLVAIHPGGKYFSLKRWPVKKFRVLLKRLDQDLNCRVLIVGGMDDCELAAEIIDLDYNYYHCPVDFSGELGIKETAALLGEIDLFIGNDSAPQHIAAAMKTPVISLFGPTNPVNFHPYGTEYRLLRKDLNCSPCFSWLGDLRQYLPDFFPDWTRNCRGVCMKEIKTGEVLTAADYFLGRYRQRKQEILV